MDFADLLEQVDEPWRADFLRFVNDQEASPEFEAQLNRDDALQRLVEAAIERKVSPEDLRLAFWKGIAQVNRDVVLTLRQAIEGRVVMAKESSHPGRSRTVSKTTAVDELDRDIEELGTGIQSVGPASRQEDLPRVRARLGETIEKIADVVVQLAVAKAQK